MGRNYTEEKEGIMYRIRKEMIQRNRKGTLQRNRKGMIHRD